jgi:hypothetical protein
MGKNLSMLIVIVAVSFRAHAVVVVEKFPQLYLPFLLFGCSQFFQFYTQHNFIIIIIIIINTTTHPLYTQFVSSANDEEEQLIF